MDNFRSFIGNSDSFNNNFYICRIDDGFFFLDTDLVIIGSGPGGYVAAIKASQLGLNVRVIIFF